MARARDTSDRATWAARVVALVVALAAVVTLAVGFLGGVLSADDAYVSPYDWDGLQADGDRLSYFSDGVLCSQVGVDVSSHQGDVDWQAVADDGIGFALVRLGNRGLTEGQLYADERAADNLDGAAEAGLDVGAYFFSQATTVEEAEEEARLALEVLDGRALDLPVAFDHEATGRAAGVDDETLAACVAAFCETIEAAGYEAMVYGNAADLERYDAASLDGRLVWYAEYGVSVPSAQLDFVLWQYTDEGSVDGIEGDVDLSLRMTEWL